MRLTTSGPFGAVTAMEIGAFHLFATATAGGAGTNLQTGGLCWPGNGTTMLSVPDYASPVLRSAAGASFTLLRFNVAEYSCVISGPQWIRFVAGFSDGRSVWWDYQLDGLSDFGGPLDDFESVELPGSFADAAWVRFEGNMMLDNLEVALTIPEPSPALLLVVFCFARSLRRTGVVHRCRASLPPRRVADDQSRRVHRPGPRQEA